MIILLTMAGVSFLERKWLNLILSRLTTTSQQSNDTFTITLPKQNPNIERMPHFNQRFGKIKMFAGPILIIVTSLPIIIMNSVILGKLGPSYNAQKIKFGLFDQNEINSIKNGNYIKDKTFDLRTMQNAASTYKANNEFNFIKVIQCTREARLFYADCINSFSLQFNISYKEKDTVPSFYCLKEEFRNTNGSRYCGCTQLASSGYSIIMIQEVNKNRVELAWTGLSKCDKNINVQLTHDLTMETCFNQNYYG